MILKYIEMMTDRRIMSSMARGIMMSLLIVKIILQKFVMLTSGKCKLKKQLPTPF